MGFCDWSISQIANALKLKFSVPSLFKFSFMKPQILVLMAVLSASMLRGQDNMSPKNLWQVKDVDPVGISKDGKAFYYKVSTPNVTENDFEESYYRMSVEGGEPQKVDKADMAYKDKNISPDGDLELFHKKVDIKDILAEDIYEDLPKSDAYVIKSLDYRHWDEYNDGRYNHVFYKERNGGKKVDIMPNEPYYTPQAPFGGDEDYTWGPEGKTIFYVSKKKEGTAYATSTDTDIYKYNLKSGETENITESNDGYDTNPAFSEDGILAWLQMKTPGYEADKNDIVILKDGTETNLTREWDGTVSSFLWDKNGKTIYFNAPVDGTIQLFKVNIDDPKVEQISDGQFDVTGIMDQVGDKLLVTRTDMNHAAEIFSYDLNSNSFDQLTGVNDELYEKFDLPEIEKRYVETQDGHKMLVWVVLPPNFDKSKKYPTLLYAQGGPQAPLSQFYSRRWNFQLMASRGYIVVAPNRRGMPGHGVEWNQAISEHWGEGAMQDYLDVIDDMTKEDYVDEDRLGAVGASFGGYSMFWLAGNHEGRFKTFIAHDGVFDTRAMYGTTEELWFVNHDLGGPYWETDNDMVQKSYNEFNPVNYVQDWDTPMMIVQGGKDYRVPIEQGLGAFQAAQLQGIKSKLLYLPEENHWVLQPQNAMVWQREFFKWLEKTL